MTSRVDKTAARDWHGDAAYTLEFAVEGEFSG
jgi:hypothetical protein